MAEPERRIAPHRSVFVRLIAIMLVMAAFILVMVAGFYFMIIIPGIHHSIDGIVSRHVRMIAENRPTLAQAREIAAKLDMDVRFEGRTGSWTTDEAIPTHAALARMRGQGHRFGLFLPRNAYYLIVTPDGTWIFSRRFGARFARAHNHMVVMLLVLMAGVFATAYTVMRKALRPLRLLETGVREVGEGNLEVVVHKQSDDEFGVLTDAFNQMARRVRAMLRSRDQLLLDVSHELRSPLTRMKVALAMMPESAQRASMAADVAEMETMVTELLELERLREGHGIQTAQTDLVALVREMADRFADRPPGVRVTRAPAGAPAEIDRERIRTVLRNLLENAIKFSLPDSRAVEIAMSEDADGYRIEVSDDGSGIPAGAADTLFEPFFRLDPSRSKKTGGYGLGLSICKRIMEAHGGTIAVAPRPGRGATFVLTLPRGT
jgi:signal transduction histidine kinase